MEERTPSSDAEDTVTDLARLDAAQSALGMRDDDAELAALDQAVEVQSEGWNPEPGTKLVGRILQIGTCDCGGYGAHPMLEVVTTDGEVVAVHAFHEVLRNAVQRWAPKHGDKVAVKYFGRLDLPDHPQGGYENYRLLVIPAERSLA